MYEGVGLYTKMESHDNSKMWKQPFLLQFYLYITLAFPPTFPSFPIIFFLKGKTSINKLWDNLFKSSNCVELQQLSWK